MHTTIRYGQPQQPVTGFVIVEDNVLDLPADQRGFREHALNWHDVEGLLLNLENSDDVHIRRNVSAGRRARAANCVDVTLEDNVDLAGLVTT